MAFSLNHSSEKKMLKKKTFLHWIGWEIGTTFHEQLQCKLKQNEKKNVRLHLTPNWKWLLRHTCLYCWRNSALGSLMFGSSQKVMQKLNEDNKNKNQLCHNAPGSLHYLEIVAPRIMLKRLLKQKIYFSLCQRWEQVGEYYMKTGGWKLLPKTWGFCPQTAGFEYLCSKWILNKS